MNQSRARTTLWTVRLLVAAALGMAAVTSGSGAPRPEDPKQNTAPKPAASGGGSAADAATNDSKAESEETDAPELEPGASADLPGFLGGRIDMKSYLHQRQEHVDQLRGVPYASKNGDLRGRAIRQMERQERRMVEALIAGGLAPLTWTEIGPAPIPNGQTTVVQTPVSGRVSALAIHPTNPDIVYVGGAQAGVYSSLDGGATWTAIFDNAESLAIGAIAIAPSQPSTVYVGTGEPGLSGDAFFGVGLYRIDNADTAPILNGPINPVASVGTCLAGTFTGRTITEILVHPTDPATIWVSTATGISGLGASARSGTVPPLGVRGIYRSANATAAVGSIAFQKLTVTASGSVTCDTASTGNVSIMDMAMEPGNPDNIIATVLGIAPSDGGIYRTTNATAATPAFTQVQTMPAGLRAELAINKVGSTVTAVVASGESAAGTGCTVGSGALRKSTDGGATWSGKLSGGGGFCGGQCFYDIAVDLHPADANTVILGGAANGTCSRDYVRSTDGGATFTAPGVADVGLHVDTHALAFAPSDPSVVYNGNDGGIYRSDDGGNTWTSLNNSGFSATQFQSLALHPIDREFMIGGTQDNGTEFKRPDGVWYRADFGDGGFARIDRNAADTSTVTMYHTYFNQTNAMGFARVDTAADATEGNWPFFGCGFVPPPGNGLNCPATAILFYAPMELGPGSPQTVYFGSDALFRSTNKGVSMSAASQVPIQSGVAVSAIGISPQDDNVRMVGMRLGRVFATTTGSTTLTEVTGPWPTSAAVTSQPRRFVSRVVIDPNDKNTAYVTFATWCDANIFGCAQVWKTTNLDGAPPTWTMANSGIPDVPVSGFVVDPRDSDTLYAGTDIGVYRSTNGGSSWAPYGTGLPRVAVFEIALQVPTATLRVATHGRGIWEIKAGLATPTFSNLSSPLIVAGETPTVLSGTIKAGSLVPPGFVSITLSSVTQDATIDPSTGNFSASFDTSALGPGSYPIAYDYPGSPGDFASATGGGTLTVVASLSPTSTSITAPTVTYPANGAVTVDVTSPAGTPTGNVLLSVDAGPAMSQPLVAGSATFTLINPSAGAHALNATYPRQATFEGSTASNVLVVNKATPVFSNLSSPVIASGQAPSIPGGTISAGGAVPSGNVAITLNGVTQFAAIDTATGSFSSRFDTSTLALGSYPISYDFAGNQNFQPASGGGTLEVVIGTTSTSSNTSPITINDTAPATPYPSTIVVSGETGQVLEATVTLTGFGHTFVGDTAALLVSPSGQTTALMYHVGGDTSGVPQNFTFDDAGPLFSPTTGTYRPTQSPPIDNFPGPAPSAPYGTTLFAQNGATPNGTWSLYVSDDFAIDIGSISGGWTLSLTTGSPGPIPPNANAAAEGRATAAAGP